MPDKNRHRPVTTLDDVPQPETPPGGGIIGDSRRRLLLADGKHRGRLPFRGR